MAQRAQIQEAMDSNGPYDSVEVGLDRNELMKIFAAMAREDAENEVNLIFYLKFLLLMRLNRNLRA